MACRKIDALFLMIAVMTLFNLKMTRAAGDDSTLINHLKERYPDWEPTAILDIGANVGGWALAANKLFPNSKILMLEASELHANVLKNVASSMKHADFQIAVMTETDGDVMPFFQNNESTTGNSIFKEQTKYFRNVKPINRTTSKLDTIVHSSSLLTTEEVDFIKLDVQGAELMVLRGGLETLRKATFVQFEGSTIQYNVGGSCFYEVDELLRSHGFYLYHHADFMIHAGLFKTHGLGQWNMLYVRPNSNRLPQGLKRLNPKFCGSQRTLPRQGMNSMEYRDSLDDRYAQECFWSGWLSGMLLGILGTLVVTRLRLFSHR